MNTTLLIGVVIGVCLIFAIVYVTRHKGKCPDCTPSSCAGCTRECAYRTKMLEEQQDPALRLKAEKEALQKQEQRQLKQEEQKAGIAVDQHESKKSGEAAEKESAGKD